MNGLCALRIRALTLFSLPVLCLWLSGGVSMAQGTDIRDSLENAIRTAKHDTARIAATLGLSELLYMSDPDSNLRLCVAIQREIHGLLSEPRLHAEVRTKLLQLEGTALNNKAVSHFVFGELDSALMLFKEAEVRYAEHGPVALLAAALSNQGLVYGLQGDHDRHGRYLHRALEIHRSVNDHINVAGAYLNIGNYWVERGMPDSAMHYFHTGWRGYEAAGHTHGIANSRLNIGQALSDQGRPAEAVAHLMAARDLYEQVGDIRAKAVCYNNLGNILMNQGLTAEALRHFHQALDLNEQLGASIQRANILLNMGNLMDRQGDPVMARTYYEECLAVYSSAGDRGGEALIHGHLGDIWKKSGDKAKAAHHFATAISIAEAHELPRELASSLYKLGRFKEDEGEPQAALDLYLQGLALDRSTGERSSEAYSLHSIAALHLEQHRPAEAIRYAKASLKVAEEIGYPEEIMRAAKVLYQALERLGRYKEALEALSLHHMMLDSVENAEQAKEIVRLQLVHGFQRKQLSDSLAHVKEVEDLGHQRQLAELRSGQARNRLWAMGIAALIMFASGIAVHRLDRNRRKERHERRTAQLQMRLLRAQMNPHFLFNALHGLHGFIQEREPELATAFLARYTRLMRLVLEHSRREEITLAEELEALTLYLDLERTRLKDKFCHEVTIAPDIDPERTLVPPMMLQPFAENAIWHGISPKEGPGHIRISIEQDGPYLRARVEDDGVGRHHATDAGGAPHKQGRTSLGTTIIRERLELLEQRHGIKCALSYVDLQQGTRVELTMPLMAAER